MNEIALKFLFANLAAAGAILLVIALRKPARMMFGAQLAYALWLLVPFAALASLLPPRVVDVVIPAMEPSPTGFDIPAPLPFTAAALALPESPTPAPTTEIASWLDPWALGFLAWLGGAIAMLVWQLRNQSRFMADARAGFAGPAVAGFLRPRIVTPADFDHRFDESERQMILVHERTHIARNDARINALAAMIRCLCWFNPFIHYAAHLMRMDQEVACDAAVARRHPKARAAYASALLKAQLAARPLPLGCYWPARSEHPLTERIEMLKRTRPTLPRRIAGASALALIAAGSGLAAWAAMPPAEHVVLETPQDQPAPPATDPRSPASDEQAPLTPQPVRYEPQTPSSPLQEPVWQKPAPATDIPAGYDGSAPLQVSGKVERISFNDKTYDVFVRATSISGNGGWGAKADKTLWQLNPTPYWGDRDAVNAELMGKQVLVSGVRARDATCATACRMYARDIQTARVTALPALASTPAFGVADFALHYDTSRQTLFQGKVRRVEFGDRSFDVYVETKGWGGHPDWVYQVRSEYRHPRAEIEKLLLNQTISVAGWLGRLPIDQVYESPTAVYGTEFQLADGRKMRPAAEKLLSEPVAAGPGAMNIERPPADPDRLPWIPPGFALATDAFDLDAPVVIDGRITRADAEGWWVEVIGFDPASTPGATAGALWRVIGGGKDKQPDIGKRITIRGYNAKAGTCQPTCLMSGNGELWIR
jgi:beta-lactamase regulating signal transducer with metallopeptidase domain